MPDASFSREIITRPSESTREETPLFFASITYLPVSSALIRSTSLRADNLTPDPFPKGKGNQRRWEGEPEWEPTREGEPEEVGRGTRESPECGGKRRGRAWETDRSSIFTLPFREGPGLGSATFVSNSLHRLFRDPSQDHVSLVADGVVSHVKHFDAEPAQARVAAFVVFAVRVMWRAIKFDGESGGVAVEVEDEGADHLLAPEVKTAELAAANCAPEHPLRGRHHAAEGFCECELGARNVLSVDDRRKNARRGHSDWEFSRRGGIT